jgi:hypothetical protein
MIRDPGGLPALEEVEEEDVLRAYPACVAYGFGTWQELGVRVRVEAEEAVEDSGIESSQ